MTVKRSTTVDPAEAALFARAAAEWWDPKGPLRPLHKLNPVRLDFLRGALVRHFRRDPRAIRPLAGLKVLDLGCGGGLLSEPLARMGAAVTGADVSDETIGAAAAHAAQAGLEIEYRRATAEELAESGARFDAVVASEVVEHVADVDLFLAACRQLTENEGAFVFSTLNRTAASFALAIVAAEYVLGWAPRGTHDWKKFLTPEELDARLDAAGFSVRGVSGMRYDPLGDAWSLSKDTSVNYIGWATPKTG